MKPARAAKTVSELRMMAASAAGVNRWPTTCRVKAIPTEKIPT